MPEPLLHVTIPFMALILLRVRAEKAFICSLAGLIPDLDVLFLIHRSVTHSIFLWIVLLLPAAHLIKKKVGKTLASYLSLSLLVIIIHIIMDSFTWYTPLFWPFFARELYFVLEMSIYIESTPLFLTRAEILSRDISFEKLKSFDAPIFTGEGLILSAIIFSSLVISRLAKLFR